MWAIAQVPRIVGSRRMGPAGQVDGRGDPVSVGTRARYLCVGLSIFPRQTARHKRVGADVLVAYLQVALPVGAPA